MRWLNMVNTLQLLIERLFSFEAKHEHIKNELLKATDVTSFLQVIVNHKMAVT